MRIAAAELRRLRNAVPVDEVIRQLGIPHKRRDGLLRFCCPLCSDFHTATHHSTNLARCFRCRRNFNPLDLVIVVERVSFLDAVSWLRPLLPGAPQEA